jgi:glycerol-3-phosphate dehydrogenase
VVVNCAGPWTRGTAERFHQDVPRLFRPSLALNVLLDRAPLAKTGLAVAPKRPGGRTYFLHPSQNRILAGTFHASWTGSADDPHPPEGALQEFVGDLNAAIPGLNLRRDEILRIYAGFLPARAEGSPDTTAREVLHDHAADGGPRGLFSVSGVKLTTARRVAEKSVRAIFGARIGSTGAQEGAATRPPPREILSADRLLRLLRDDPADAVAFVTAIIREEAVVHLEDLLLRRTGWGGDPEQWRRMEQAGVGELLAPLLERKIPREAEPLSG